MPTESTLAANLSARTKSRRCWTSVLETVLIFAVFAAFAGRPFPDVNEAHYLGKAKHYWDGTWCANDFFLSSADAHHAFYWTVGALTNCFSLSVVAWIGRCAGWLVLAIGWRKLHRALGGAPFTAWKFALLLALLSKNLQMANEWFLGGIEGKVFAWGFVFLGLASIVRNRWVAALTWLGLATAFHILVGGWATAIAAFTWWWCKEDRQPLSKLLPGIVLWFLLAGPFLYLGLQLSAGADPATATAANLIHVNERIHHHLHPLRFAWPGVVRHGVGWLVLLGLCVSLSPILAERRFRTFIFGAGAISSLGLLIAVLLQGSPEWSARLLRFYWFRAADVLLPVGLALTAVRLWAWAELPLAIRKFVAAAAAIFVVITGWEYSHEAIPRGDKTTIAYADEFNKTKGVEKTTPTAVFASWRELCDWVRENTPQGAIFLTPAHVSTFKLYAERGEVTTWKDVPQDAPRVVEWWDRMQAIHVADTKRQPPEPALNNGRWRTSLGTLGTARLVELARTYKADYIVVVKIAQVPTIDLPLVHENSHFALYRTE